MKKKLLFLCIALLLFCIAESQHIQYTVANGHSHNDYENTLPFITAYNEKFGSIEADIFLWNDSLVVGHTTADTQYKRTLQGLYLDPLQDRTSNNNGHPYKDPTLSLQLLIDIKTNAVPTLDRLVQVLQQYSVLINCKKISFVITGNRPAESTFNSYPSFILFDGEFKKEYSADALKKIALFSGDLKNYTQWNGKDIIPRGDKTILYSIIKKAHGLHKKIRFWNAPDVINAWLQFIQLEVDFINTDHIRQLSVFMAGLSINHPIKKR